MNGRRGSARCILKKNIHILAPERVKYSRRLNFVPPVLALPCCGRMHCLNSDSEKIFLSQFMTPSCNQLSAKPWPQRGGRGTVQRETFHLYRKIKIDKTVNGNIGPVDKTRSVAREALVFRFKSHSRGLFQTVALLS